MEIMIDTALSTLEAGLDALLNEFIAVKKERDELLAKQKFAHAKIEALVQQLKQREPQT